MLWFASFCDFKIVKMCWCKEFAKYHVCDPFNLGKKRLDHSSFPWTSIPPPHTWPIIMVSHRSPSPSSSPSPSPWHIIHNGCCNTRQLQRCTSQVNWKEETNLWAIHFLSHTHMLLKCGCGDVWKPNKPSKHLNGWKRLFSSNAQCTLYNVHCPSSNAQDPQDWDQLSLIIRLSTRFHFEAVLILIPKHKSLQKTDL